MILKITSKTKLKILSFFYFNGGRKKAGKTGTEQLKKLKMLSFT